MQFIIAIIIIMFHDCIIIIFMKMLKERYFYLKRNQALKSLGTTMVRF